MNDLTVSGSVVLLLQCICAVLNLVYVWKMYNLYTLLYPQKAVVMFCVFFYVSASRIFKRN